MGRVVLCPDVSHHVGFSRGFGAGTIACIISLIFLIFLKQSANKLLFNHFVLRKNNSTIFHSCFHLFLCFVISEKCEKIRVLRRLRSNFHVTTGMDFIFMHKPGFVSMCKHCRITHIKTIAQIGFI